MTAPRSHPCSARWGRRHVRTTLACVGSAVLLVAVARIRGQGSEEYERPPVSYSRSVPEDAVARLLPRIARREVVLQGSDEDILRGVLRELQIPVESQVVVFSRTSLQAGLIRPDHPRALYFSESAYVGWVPGGLIEVVAVDPQLGPVFYALDPDDAREARRTFVRETSCLRCHGGTFVRDIPGLFARSVFVSAAGEPLLRHGTELVDDTTPFERRWGGWYVTGYTGGPDHRGNALARERGDQLDFVPSDRRPMALSEVFDASGYPVATSDVVALLVFEHQLAMHNSLTRAGQSVRRALEYQRSLQTSAHEPVTSEPTYESVKRIVAGAAQDVLDHLLFRGAAPLPGGLGGSDAFRRAFAAGGRRSSGGDALRDFSPRDRLFANRCSFLIYSDSFRSLPDPLKNRILDGLARALDDDDPTHRYAYLEPDEKHRIAAVLAETLVDARRHFEMTSR